jgi:hydroxymethylpyrimidine kinase/phosphomethylpyrimidine kinase
MNRLATAPVALTVAGSDSGGGAGIQADLKTFHALGVFGTSAITAITCQNPDRVSAVQPVSPRIVAGQIDRVLEAFPVRAAKTGMLYNAGIIEVVAARRWKNLVVDPVMIAGSGALLLRQDAIRALGTQLLPRATLVTPNVPEAEILLKHKVTSAAKAARELSEIFGVPFLVKGGHLPGEPVDALSDGHEFPARRVPRVKLHGAGCTYSAAIAAHLALGCNLVEAIGRAKLFVTQAIRGAGRIGKYHVLRI